MCDGNEAHLLLPTTALTLPTVVGTMLPFFQMERFRFQSRCGIRQESSMASC